jgi:acyl-phosphate glycerol 3-phosphate acyltransferase
MTALQLLGPVTLGSYLIGAIPFGYLIARARGVNIFQQGSGNIGATNVGRVLGRRFGILVFVLDFAKGALPVLAAGQLANQVSADLPAHSLEVAAGLAAFLGHLFPVYLRFRGGKGVATGAGIVAVLLPVPALWAFFTWFAVLCAWQYVSLASIAAVLVLCLSQLGQAQDPFGPETRTLTLLCFVAAGLVIARHAANIGRLLQGRENRLKESASMLYLTKLIHVLTLGLWFGSVVFFTFSALIVFDSFKSLTTQIANRPDWLPTTMTPDQANQLAGYAVGPIFPWYFLLQGVCGVLALVTCLAWSRWEPQAAIHRVRFIVLALALATVIPGLLLSQKVGALRMDRYSREEAVATAAKAEFGRWHTYSLLLNFVTMGLVTAGMAMTARLPNTNSLANSGTTSSAAERKTMVTA